MSEEEEILLDDGNAFVSTTRIVLGETTYSTANITSVQKTTVPEQRGCAISVAVFGVMVLLIAFEQSAYLWLLFGVVLAGLGLLVAIGAKKQYVIKFTLSSGEIEALCSEDESMIDGVVTAVNNAIIARG